jgi:hypothetical protein
MLKFNSILVFFQSKLFTLAKFWNNTIFKQNSINICLSTLILSVESTQKKESKCKLKPQNYWINTNLVLNYLELKMNLCYFSVDIWVDTIKALKQHNLSVETYINHFKVSNQHYLRSIDSIDTKIVLNQHCFAFYT